MNFTSLRAGRGWFWLALGLLPTLLACQPRGTQQEPATESAFRVPPPHEARDPLDTDGGKRIVLTVVGINNTNRDIDDFSVNGAGGGNLRAGSGGGGSCCSSIPKDIPWDLLEFKVRWTAGGCMRKMKFSNGEPYETIEYFYKEKLVKLTDPLPSKPSDLEVHFFPGERIEVRITEIGSLPLPFDKSKEDLTPPPICEEKKP